MDYARDLSERIQLALVCGGTVTQMSRDLGIDRAHIYRAMRAERVPAAVRTASRMAEWCDTLIDAAEGDVA